MKGGNVRQKVLDICEAVIPTFAGKAHEFIDVVHRLGEVRSENALSSGQKPRGIILQFTMRHFRDALWKAAKNSPYLAKHHGSQKICLLRIESSETNFGLWLRKLSSKDAALTSLVQRRTLMVKNLFYRTWRSPSELNLS